MYTKPDKERDCNYYDNMYCKFGGHSTIPDEDHNYYYNWITVIKEINKNEFVADFGCGSGQFANLLLQFGYHFSYGIDFSNNAIKIAKKLNHNDKFYTGNLLDKEVFGFGQYDVAVLLETLEHITNDLEVLSYIPSRTKVIFSVPTFDSDGHVRYFNNVDEVINRYSELVEIKKIIIINPGANVSFYIAVGKRN